MEEFAIYVIDYEKAFAKIYKNYGKKRLICCRVLT